MLKTNKLVSLGVLSVIGLGLAVAPTVSADSSNSTNFGYTAGQAGGGDKDDWILDMPVRVSLTDANNSVNSAAPVTFNIYNNDHGAGKNPNYTGNTKVTVNLDTVNTSTGGNVSDNKIQMVRTASAGIGATTNGTVGLTLTDKGNNVVDPHNDKASTRPIVTLGKVNGQSVTSESGKAYITKTGTFAKGDTFASILTWAISPTDGSQAQQPGK